MDNLSKLRRKIEHTVSALRKKTDEAPSLGIILES